MPICYVHKLTVAENDGKLVMAATLKRTKSSFTIYRADITTQIQAVSKTQMVS